MDGQAYLTYTEQVNRLKFNTQKQAACKLDNTTIKWTEVYKL